MLQSLNMKNFFACDSMEFYLRGMCFINKAFLKKSDLKNGYVTYRRRKTGQQLIIEWTREIQMILDKYTENKSDYLLPVIRTPGINERCTYRNTGYNINHNLKRIAKMVDVTIPLTPYVARRSWASAAKAKGIPLSVISEGMGHDSEATTQIYLASLDTSVVDRANSLILNSSNKFQPLLNPLTKHLILLKILLPQHQSVLRHRGLAIAQFSCLERLIQAQRYEICLR